MTKKRSERRPHIVYMTAYFLTPDQPGLMRAWQVARFLVERGYRVTVLTTGTHYMTARPIGRRTRHFSRRHVDGIDVIEVYGLTNYRDSLFRRMGYSITLAVFSFLAGLRLPAIDVVLAATPPPTTPLLGWMLARLRRAKFVYEVRDFQIEDAIAVGFLKPGLLSRSVVATETWICQVADGIIAVTPGIKRILLKTRRVDSDKVAVVPNGYEGEVFERADFSRNVRTEFGWGARFIVLYAGSLGQTYDILTLIRAARLLREDPRFLFVIIGEGERKREYQRFCDDHSLTNCQFLPAQRRADIPVFCRAADACVSLFPRGDLWAHVLGNKVFDYLGSGTPMLYAGTGDTAELLERSGGGVVVPPQDPEALRDALLWLYEHPDDRHSMGERGREYVVAHHSRTVLLETLAVQIELVLNGESSKVPVQES